MRVVALLLAVAVLSAVPKGRAQSPVPALAPNGASAKPWGPRLEYKRGPAECLPELEFRREVAIAGDGVDRFEAAGVDVMRVRFERTARGYRGTIEFTEASGEKRPRKVIEHPNCEMLGRWVGVAAYYYFPEREPEPEPAPKQPDPVVCKLPEAFVPPPLPPAHLEPWPDPSPSSSFWERVRRMDLTIGLSAYALVTAGLTANVGPGFAIAADARGEIFSLGLELRGVLPGITYASAPIDSSAPFTRGHFDLSQWTGLLVPCTHYKYFVGCAVAQAGVFTIQTSKDQVTLPAISFGPRLGFEVPFADRFAVFGFGEALFAAGQAGTDDVPHNVEWTQSIVSGFFGAGLSINFK